MDRSLFACNQASVEHTIAAQFAMYGTIYFILAIQLLALKMRKRGRRAKVNIESYSIVCQLLFLRTPNYNCIQCRFLSKFFARLCYKTSYFYVL